MADLNINSIQIGNFLQRKVSEDFECENIDQINDLEEGGKHVGININTGGGNNMSILINGSGLSPNKRSQNFLMKSTSMGDLNLDSLNKKLFTPMILINNQDLKNSTELQQENKGNRVSQLLKQQQIFQNQDQLQVKGGLISSRSLQGLRKGGGGSLKNLGMQNVEFQAANSKKLIIEIRRKFDLKEIQQKRLQLMNCNRQSSEQIINENGVEQNQNCAYNENSPRQRICKICLEPELEKILNQNNNNQNNQTNCLISPCQCSGSCKWVHSECLKEWIVSKQIVQMNKGEGEEELMDFGSAYCEICAATYKMKIVYGNIFNCAQGFKEHLTALKIAFVSFILCSLLAFILFFFFFTPYKENHLKEGFKFAIIFCCVIVFLLFFLILVLSLREAFYYEKIVEWQIFNYENNQQIDRNNQLQVINVNRNSNQNSFQYQQSYASENESYY